MPSFCKVCGDIMKGPKCKCGATMGTSGNADTFESDGGAPVHTQYTDAYVSTGLMKGLDDGLRRMADIRPEWVDKTCCKCNRACTEGAIEGPYGTSEQGKAFCKPCFDKNFAKGECANCHDPVYSFDNQKWVKHEGKVYHDVCYNQERRCHVCRKPILGGAVNALGRDYCEGCFQCGGCQAPFKGGSFFEFHGAPYCRKCLDEAKATNKGVITKTVQKQDPRVDSLNAKVYERQGELNDLKKFQHVSIGDKCSKCKEEIISNAVTVGTGVLFHPECFTCSVCNKGFPDMTFAEKNGLVYHGDCLNKASADKCAGCAQPITKGKHLVYEGKKYHADCFTCGNCKKSLAGIPFGESKGKNLCEGCLNSESKVTHGDYRPGFTVNPVSGQKEQRGAGGAKLGAKPAGLGQGNECPGCHKAVFMSEQVMGPMGSHWHRACLKCNGCGKALDSMAQQKNDTVYCRDCAKKY